MDKNNIYHWKKNQNNTKTPTLSEMELLDVSLYKDINFSQSYLLAFSL